MGGRVGWVSVCLRVCMYGGGGGAGRWVWCECVCVCVWGGGGKGTRPPITSRVSESHARLASASAAYLPKRRSKKVAKRSKIVPADARRRRRTDWPKGDRLVKWRPTGQMAADWSNGGRLVKWRPTGQTMRRPESRPRPAGPRGGVGPGPRGRVEDWGPGLASAWSAAPPARSRRV